MSKNFFISLHNNDNAVDRLAFCQANLEHHLNIAPSQCVIVKHHTSGPFTRYKVSIPDPRTIEDIKSILANSKVGVLCFNENQRDIDRSKKDDFFKQQALRSQDAVGEEFRATIENVLTATAATDPDASAHMFWSIIKKGQQDKVDAVNESRKRRREEQAIPDVVPATGHQVVRIPSASHNLTQTGAKPQKLSVKEKKP